MNIILWLQICWYKLYNFTMTAYFITEVWTVKNRGYSFLSNKTNLDIGNIDHCKNDIYDEIFQIEGNLTPLKVSDRKIKRW